MSPILYLRISNGIGIDLILACDSGLRFAGFDFANDLADALLKGYRENHINADWLGRLKLSEVFKPFLQICKEQVINEVAALLPNRIKEYLPKKRKHDCSPLGFACELAARELNMKQKNNSLYSVGYLLRIYRENGGSREKARKQRKPTKTANKFPLQ